MTLALELILPLLLAQTSTATAAEEPVFDSTELTADFTETDSPQLNLYGFIDFGYGKTFTSRRSLISDLVERDSFAVGSLNLYLSAKLSARWRSLAEVRFLYAPNGTDAIDLNTGKITTTSTQYFDIIDFASPSWGGIEIQRAWVEYELHPLLTIRGGQWLTPVGIWNVDHGSPTIIPVHQPYILKLELFPIRQTGLSLHGEQGFSAGTLAYEVTLSNGRGLYESFRDLDGNKALGGRTVFTTNELGRLAIGASAYYGRFTNATRQIRVDTSLGYARPIIDTTPIDQYDELCLGGDLRWEWNGLLVQGELMMDQVRYTDVGRAPSTGLPGYTPDHTALGGYALAGYRIDAISLMPYAMVDWLNLGAPQYIDGTIAPSIGINFRPIPALAIKAQLTRYWFRIVTSLGSSNEALNAIDTQVAWAF
jgi:hypothetical protein